jgi:uncharacterized protein involved in exopolysaccharide biosynthesis
MTESQSDTSEVRTADPADRAGSRDDLDIDLGRFGGYLAYSWWIILLLIVVGAVAAVAIARLSADTYEASGSVYVGQATDATGGAIASVSSNPKAAATMATSASVLHEVAAETGIKIAKLQNAITVEIPTPTARTSGQVVNFITIHVQLSDAEKSAQVANSDARAVRDRLAIFPRRKIDFLRRRVAADTVQIARLDARSNAAQRQLNRLAATPGSAEQKALASTPYVAILQSVAATRAVVANELQSSKLQLLTSQNVEMPRVISAATVPHAKVGLDWRVAAGIGIIAGALVGIVIAVLRGRRRRSA